MSSDNLKWHLLFLAQMNCITGQPLARLWNKTQVCCWADGPDAYFQEASVVLTLNGKGAISHHQCCSAPISTTVQNGSWAKRSEELMLIQSRCHSFTPPTHPQRSGAAEAKPLDYHRGTHRWLPKERQPVAGFRGRRDAAVPIWLPKQLWGLICPTLPQRRGCNSIASWPTVLPFAGAELLRKCPGKCPVEQKACRLCNSHRACPFFFPLSSSPSLLNISSFIQQSITEAT